MLKEKEGIYATRKRRKAQAIVKGHQAMYKQYKMAFESMLRQFALELEGCPPYQVTDIKDAEQRKIRNEQQAMYLKTLAMIRQLGDLVKQIEEDFNINPDSGKDVQLTLVANSAAKLLKDWDQSKSK